MATLAPSLSAAHPAARAHSKPKSYNRVAAWRDLMIGSGPLWYRIAGWGQRHNAA